MSDKPRGTCPVCRFRAALRKDGTLYRHWAGFGDQLQPYPKASPCSGWKRKPVEMTLDRTR